MISIKNKKDLRFWYEILKAIETKLTKNDEAIIRIKKAIRFYIHKNNDVIVYSNNIDKKFIIEKIPADWTKDQIDMENWFYWFRYQDITPSLYDCSGQWFTSYWKIVKKPSGFYLYHILYYDC